MNRFIEKDIKERKDEFEKLLQTDKAKDKLPIICEPGKGSKFDKEDMKPLKLLCHRQMKMSKLHFSIRQRIKHLNKYEGIFLLVGNTVPPINDTVGNIYNLHKNKDDGFLYINFTPETTFG